MGIQGHDIKAESRAERLSKPEASINVKQPIRIPSDEIREVASGDAIIALRNVVSCPDKRDGQQTRSWTHRGIIRQVSRDYPPSEESCLSIKADSRRHCSSHQHPSIRFPERPSAPSPLALENLAVVLTPSA